MKDKRSIFSNKRKYHYTLIFYISSFCFIIALFDWNLINFFISNTININNVIRRLFLFVNLWIITLFILCLSAIKAKIKFENILNRLKDISKSNIYEDSENFIYYRKNDPFSFFSKTYNDFVHNNFKRRKNIIKKINNFQNILDKTETLF